MSEAAFATCIDCNKSFSGPENYTEHLASKAHDKKVTEKRKQMMYSGSNSNEGKLKCDVCNVFLSGQEPMKQHINGNKHLSMLKKKDILQSIEPSVNWEPSENLLTCKVCEKCFSGPENLKQHMNSKKHLRRMDLTVMKQQLGGVQPSCPPLDAPVEKIYPSLTEDYKIVHQSIENKNSKPKKSMGCFSAVKQLFKSKKDKELTEKKTKHLV